MLNFGSFKFKYMILKQKLQTFDQLI
uniref:Uncharacterized protein n=1 Tax=Arundo donax TaxID=35708 RepID=A0A0A9F7T5_ARUDO